ncbi:MAG: glycosyltransferase, partial [Bacteroidetes bacterium]|nr:glycosyltransferase [Bacteroidota bacterium]
AGYNVKFIPYDKVERTIGKSQYNFFKRFNNFYSAFLNVSYLPLRFLTVAGLLVAFSGLIYTISIVYAYFVNQTPFEGWAPLMILLLFLGGGIMLMLGILGEYIWRILDEIKERPHYLVQEEML